MNSIWSEITADLKEGIAESMGGSDAETIARLNRLIAITAMAAICIGMVVMRGGM